MFQSDKVSKRYGAVLARIRMKTAHFIIVPSMMLLTNSPCAKTLAVDSKIFAESVVLAESIRLQA